MKVRIDEYRDPDTSEVTAIDVACYCGGERVLLLTNATDIPEVKP